jgi:hypothetical protein
VRSLAAVLLAVAVFTGCTSPKTRIKKSPELFATLSASDQQLIKEGRAALGFTPDMVKLALGDPDRVSTRTDAMGVSEVWRYTTYETDGGVYLYRGYYHRYYTGYGGAYSPYPFPYYMDYPSRRDREYLRITFTGGRVSAIDEER